MTAAGITGKRLFEQNGFYEADRKGRFELMVKKFGTHSPDPKLIDWEAKQEHYKGWHLLYADQCPYHDKTVSAIKETAKQYKISLQIKKIASSQEAKNGPSGFGVFSLLYDGKLLEDHYISQTRFKSILKKELQLL